MTFGAKWESSMLPWCRKDKLMSFRSLQQLVPRAIAQLTGEVNKFGLANAKSCMSLTHAAKFSSSTMMSQFSLKARSQMDRPTTPTSHAHTTPLAPLPSSSSVIKARKPPSVSCSPRETILSTSSMPLTISKKHTALKRVLIQTFKSQMERRLKPT